MRTPHPPWLRSGALSQRKRVEVRAIPTRGDKVATTLKECGADLGRGAAYGTRTARPNRRAALALVA